jgi:hypothetical protein
MVSNAQVSNLISDSQTRSIRLPGSGMPLVAGFDTLKSKVFKGPAYYVPFSP